MPSIQIRNVPPELYEALALRARRDGRSLAQQALIELGKLPEIEEQKERSRILRRIRQRLENQEPGQLSRAPEALIREDRD